MADATAGAADPKLAQVKTTTEEVKAMGRKVLGEVANAIVPDQLADLALVEQVRLARLALLECCGLAELA